MILSSNDTKILQILVNGTEEHKGTCQKRPLEERRRALVPGVGISTLARTPSDRALTLKGTPLETTESLAGV
ncbi:uncharacterized [Tachysurus ichikawai]